MTDSEWTLYCLTATAVIVAIMAIITLFKHYPMQDTINQTYFLISGAP